MQDQASVGLRDLCGASDLRGISELRGTSDVSDGSGHSTALRTDDARFATRFAGQLLLVGALVTLALLLSLHPNRSSATARGYAAVLSVCLVAVVSGVVLLRLRLRRPASERTLSVMTAFAVLLVGLPTAVTGTKSPAGMLLMTWPVLYAGYLLSRRTALVTLGLALVAWGVILQRTSQEGRFSAWIELLATMTLTLLIVIRLRRRAEALQDQLARQAATDPLTGLPNRRVLDEVLDREFERSRRSGAPLSLLVVDIDHFKRINDTWGHDAGDAVLRRLGRLLTELVRASDVVGRAGGEEFEAILPGVDAEQARVRAEELLAAVRESSKSWQHAITASVGVAELSARNDSPRGLRIAADQALYEAKASGRDRVCSARVEVSS